MTDAQIRQLRQELHRLALKACERKPAWEHMIERLQGKAKPDDAEPR